MNAKQVNDLLFDKLKKFGVIKWHTSTFKSYYIKFKDTRLGSIRIGDHKGRNRYSYTYEILVDTMSDFQIEQRIDTIVSSVEMKSNLNSNFDPDKFIVYSIKQEQYVEAEDFNQYKNHILKKELL